MTTPSPEITTLMDLGPIGKGVEDILSPQMGQLVGEAVAAELGRRIRHGSTATGEQIDPNAAGWQQRKILEGRLPEPLQRTGEMTEPQAWKVSAKAEGGEITIRLELDPEHREKWDNIHQIADRNGLNWDEAWGLGDSEKEIAYLALLSHIEATLEI